jgi:hypothetical protein
VAAAREIADALLDGIVRFVWKDAPDRYWPLLTEFMQAAR